MAAGRYVPRNYRWFNKLLKMSFGPWLRIAFRIEARGERLARDLRPPFVLVANHVTVLDPFILGDRLREPIYWITADGNMRTSLMKALLRMVGSIPKAKAIPDRQTVAWTIEVIRGRRGVVGIFPEGQASWDGKTLDLIPSTAKLLKFLKVPVLAAVIRGGYSSLPRWSWVRRRGKIDLDFSLALTPAELASMDAEAIGRRLKAVLAHDESVWNLIARRRFEGGRRAERLELALFMCPSCGAVGSMESSGGLFACAACGRAQILDAYGRFRDPGGGEPPFPTIPDWAAWQAGALGRRLAEDAARRPGEPLFSDAGVRLFFGRGTNTLIAYRRGTLLLFRDRMELSSREGPGASFPIAEIDGASVLRQQLLEFYVGRELYQARFPSRSISALKWTMAIEILAGLLNRGIGRS